VSREHPGQLIRHNILDRDGLSIGDAARLLGVSDAHASRRVHRQGGAVTRDGRADQSGVRQRAPAALATILRPKLTGTTDGRTNPGT
jgi:hypothetical protein